MSLEAWAILCGVIVGSILGQLIFEVLLPMAWERFREWRAQRRRDAEWKEWQWVIAEDNARRDRNSRGWNWRRK